MDNLASSAPEGDRSIWNLVWKAEVPPKLRIFAWRTATSTLAVRSGLHRRIWTVDPTCIICGRMQEDTHHALVSCTLARALRASSHYTGPEWFLNLISKGKCYNESPGYLFALEGVASSP
jgi:hypothetical protein